MVSGSFSVDKSRSRLSALLCVRARVYATLIPCWKLDPERGKRDVISPGVAALVSQLALHHGRRCTESDEDDWV